VKEGSYMIKGATDGVNQIGQTTDDATWVTIASIDTAGFSYGEDFDELCARVTTEFLGRTADHLSVTAQRAATLDITGGVLTVVADDLLGTLQAPPELAACETRISIDGTIVQAQAKGVDGKTIDWDCDLKLRAWKP
jgi:hypothetical protein